MPQNHNHKASEWRTTLRCLRILLCLLRGPATTAELLMLVEQEANERGDYPEDEPLKKRLENDIRRLRQTLKCEVKYQRSTETYELHDVGQPLIDLPDDALRGLAFLQVTFDDATLMAREVQSLIGTLTRILPAKRLRQTNAMRGMVELDIRILDNDTILDSVWDDVQQSLAQRRQLEFRYLAAGQADGQQRTHRVEPQRVRFQDGHIYLDAYCIETNGPLGRRSQQKIFPPYRLGRMLDSTILPTRFAEGNRQPRTYPLIYHLDAAIARRGVTQRFPKSVIEKQPDESAIVYTESHDLFADLRTLLKYGPGCRVLGGDEALREMKTLVSKLYQRYQGE